MKNIIIDPWTEEALMKRVNENLNEVVNSIVAQVGEYTLEDMDWRDVAALFFSNGYVNGARDAVNDERLRDDIELMKDEIEYQMKHSIV